MMKSLLPLLLSFLSLTVSAQTVIKDRPEGELKVYNRSGAGYYYNRNTQSVSNASQEGFTLSIVYAGQGKVYIKDPVSYAYTNAWVAGTQNGNTITVSLDQFVYYSSTSEWGMKLAMLDYKESEGTYVVDASTKEYTYTVSGDRVTLNGPLDNGNRILGLVYSDDNSWTGYGDFMTTYSINTDVTAEIPTSVEMKEYVNTFSDGEDADGDGKSDEYTATVLIGKKDGKVYLKNYGIAGSVIIGDLSADGQTVTFKQGQFMSNDSFLTYLVGTNDGTTLSDVFFTYDSTTDTYTLQNAYVVFNILTEQLNPVSFFTSSTLAPKVASGISIPSTGAATEKRDRQTDAIYDLSGRRLKMAPSSGIYIKNGKKYISK